MKRTLSCSLKKPGSIACLALAIAVVAPAVAESASPVRGVWQGQQTRWSGGNGWKTTLPFPVAFSLKRGSVVGFTESGGEGGVLRPSAPTPPPPTPPAGA